MKIWFLIDRLTLFVIELLYFSMLIIATKKTRNTEKSKTKKIGENSKNKYEKKRLTKK